MSSLTDRAGRWLVRHHRDRAASQLARLIIRLWGQAADPEPYVPLWIERWTVRDAAVSGLPADPAHGITADTGAVALFEQLGRQP